MNRAAREVAFRATCYRVWTDRGVFDLRIGLPNAVFDAFLVDADVARWAVLTAFNPQCVSDQSNGAENMLAHRRLQNRLEELGWAHLPACNIADGGDWPDEPGYLILHINQAEALVLARDFHQSALVCGETGSMPRLVWCEPGVDVT